jgi:mRNA-degrading endonuclease RelE of RelBE toxin-antitoxin system
MNRSIRKWDFKKPKDFRKQVLNLPHSVRPKLTEVMTRLSNPDNPNLFGKKKTTRFGKYYTIKLSNSHRLAYAANFETHRIEVYRVGEHKLVYGKD